jgi:hypothetical protein
LTGRFGRALGFEPLLLANQTASNGLSHGPIPIDGPKSFQQARFPTRIDAADKLDSSIDLSSSAVGRDDFLCTSCKSSGILQLLVKPLDVLLVYVNSIATDPELRYQDAIG